MLMSFSFLYAERMFDVYRKARQKHLNTANKTIRAEPQLLGKILHDERAVFLKSEMF